MDHSKRLEETSLWKEYAKRDAAEEGRIWVKKVYASAANYLKDVRRTFENYTLHDETHILNVLDAMGGLLGNQISMLSVRELELLILVACLHDVGMVYTDEEKQAQFENVEACKKFLKENAPELLGSSAKDWPEDIQQNYLRSWHSVRVKEVLHNKSWEKLMDEQEHKGKVVSLDCIISVCKAHGYNHSWMINNKKFEYKPSDDMDPLFCAILLRLADLLDFDDTRAPQVLYSYVECNEKSCEEWKKHQASAGFTYPESPSTKDLPYKACCESPGVEHAVRTFLDWVDVELGNCIRLQKYCEKEWQRRFPFPRAVSRKEIQSDGYMSGDFCITMDQTKILDLLTGENLYDNRDVFVRELLQNAIDATLLRAKMDADFVPEESRIDFWEWNDKDGNIWFRIDDEGTGMTMGMLQRYFLKVGNSYYSSKEIERDLRDHNPTGEYHSISHFGIGFLSCFLSGDYAEVSTLYFDSDKNRREEEKANFELEEHYGLRLQVTGLSGYYTLLNQSEEHKAKDEMPNPGGNNSQVSYKNEREGYRTKPGTSIAIRLNPGKLGTINLKETVEKYLCGARVPVYYNNERIGQTYEEVMKAAHEVEGKSTYELPEEIKKQFDQVFPELKGQYPKIVVNTILLDSEERYGLSGVNGVILKWELEYPAYWCVGNVEYHINGAIEVREKILIKLFGYNVSGDYKQSGIWSASIEKYEFMNIICQGMDFSKEHIRCAYQGVYAGMLDEVYIATVNYMGIFFLENEWQPTTQLSRVKITKLPIEVELFISIILKKYKMMEKFSWENESVPWIDINLKRWKEMGNESFLQWTERNLKSYLEERIHFLEEPTEVCLWPMHINENTLLLELYCNAYLQQHKHMEINYEQGQVITFSEKEQTEIEENMNYLFPMLYCKAKNERNRKYLCCAYVGCRKGITLNHPFMSWLIKNAKLMNIYYQRQFKHIQSLLFESDAEAIISGINEIRKQLIRLPERHGIDVEEFPQLSMEDFWFGEADD